MLNLVTFGIILSVAVICDCSCLSGTRRVRLPDGSEDCVFCKECPADQVVAKACSDKEDTICCPGNTFLSVTSMCTNCSVCPAGQYISRQCSVTEDSVCSECPDGFYTDASNSLTCQNCTTYCKYGVLGNCSRTSDTKCAVDRQEDTSPIVIIYTLIVLIVLCAISAAIYCRRKVINRKQKETSTKVNSKEEDVLLQEVYENDKSKNSKEESPQENTTFTITMTNVGDDAVLVDIIQSTNVNTNQQTGNEFDDSHFCMQQNHLNVDKNKPKTEHTKGSAAQNQERDQSKGSEICKPSIGILYYTVVERQWTVFVVGEGIVMTSIEAYECIKGVRNGNTNSEKHIQYAHISFGSFALSFKISTEMFVEKELGFVMMHLIEDTEFPKPMKLDVSPLQQGTDYHTLGLLDDYGFQSIVVKLGRMNEEKITSMKTFLTENMSTISPLRTEYCQVKTIKDKKVKLNVDADDNDLQHYNDSYCISGTSDRILLGSPLYVWAPGQEPSVVGVCTRTIPWVYHLLDTTEKKDLLNEHAYILVTPFSDILPSIRGKNNELSQKLFKSRTPP